MLIADILHSCSNDGIARAAVASIGGEFADSLRSAADRAGLSVGGFSASLVRAFALEATERDWRALTAAMSGSDQPVLAGLRAIAETMLARPDGLRRSARPARTAAPTQPSVLSPACRLL